MDQELKQDIITAMREAGFVTREEMRADMRQMFGVFEEHINEKFRLVMEAFDTIFRQLRRHDERLGEIETKLERKADVKEFDALDRRVTTLERRESAGL